MNENLRTLADQLRIGALPNLAALPTPDRQLLGDDMLAAIGACEIVDAIADEMQEMAKQLSPPEPGRFRSAARDWEILSEQMIEDGSTVDAVRNVLVRFGALGPKDYDLNIVTLLEILLPPNVPA